MGLDAKQFRLLVIRPTLLEIRLWSLAAERLLLATALHESDGLRYLRQLPDGPALGLYQMEPATHDDIWRTWLRFRPLVSARVAGLTAASPLACPPAGRLVADLDYATAMARLRYRRAPDALPDAEDLTAIAAYWKRHYNTAAGRGDVADFAAHSRPHWRTGAFRDDPRPGT